MNYGGIKNYDIANGPGVRVTLFVSGCPHHCKGCFNPETWDFDYGEPFTRETEDEVLRMLGNAPIAGLTLLGGEPMVPSNQEALLPLLREAKARYPQKNIWCFTGYLFDRDVCDGMLKKYPFTREFLSYVDIIVDGPFILAQKSLLLKFKGSSNQRIIMVKESLEAGEIVRWPQEERERAGMPAGG